MNTLQPRCFLTRCSQREHSGRGQEQTAISRGAAFCGLKGRWGLRGKRGVPSRFARVLCKGVSKASWTRLYSCPCLTLIRRFPKVSLNYSSYRTCDIATNSSEIKAPRFKVRVSSRRATADLHVRISEKARNPRARTHQRSVQLNLMCESMLCLLTDPFTRASESKTSQSLSETFPCIAHEAFSLTGN